MTVGVDEWDEDDRFIGCIGVGWNAGEEFKWLPESDPPGPLRPTRAEAEYDDEH